MANNIDKQNISDSVAIFFIILLLLTNFLPHPKSIDLLYPQFLYLSGLNLVMGLYFYFNPNVISTYTFPLLKKSYLLRLYLLFIILCAISAINTKNTTLVLEKITELIIAFCLVVNFIVLLKNRLDLFNKIVFIVGITAFIQSCVEIYNLKLLASQGTISFGLQNMVKTTGNINILASSLTIKIPFLLLGITTFSGYKKLFSYITLLLAITTILLTAARATFISLFLVYIVYIIFYLKNNSVNKSSLATSISLTIPIIIAVFITNLVFERSANEERYISLGNRVEQINLKDESIKTRITIWGNSIQLAKENPITGVGLGNYKVESIPYEKTLDNNSSISLHSHNDFLEVAAETGILNGLIYLSIFILITFINIKRIFKSAETNRKTIALLTLMMTIVYGVDSAINFPMFRPAMLIFLCLIFVLTIINTPPPSSLEFETNKSKSYLILITISIITSYFAFLNNKASSLEYLIQKDVESLFATNNLTGDELLKRIPKYKNTLSTAESFYEYAGIYYTNEKRYDDALKYLSKADKINPHFGRIFFYKMVISNAKGNIDSAYIYAKQAFYLRPRNVNFFKMSAQFARAKNDTSEIFKEHNLFIKYRNIPEAWGIAAEELQKSNYNSSKLLRFIDNGLRYHPADTLLTKQKNNILIQKYTNEGRDLFLKNDLKKSLELYQKALKIDPNNPDTMQNLAFYYYSLGKYQDAKSYFLEALKRREFKSGRTEFFIGNCYLKTNERENACKYFSISKAKNFPDAQQQLNLNCK
ncbi:O-antigen ligase family protein [Flavobacterium sp. PL02]|uniref:O-antigen ligase family protein n=1 Tax=Flavobacterium sp. PL02 TaxID=3088354 RepID=UPI002B23C971|nr:O-antigen ligase family protein [Flavobacterium sp. PL02]MEA9412578.1 O-antigen ligase family protein [Flavobacterium sp. PL02]